MDRVLADVAHIVRIAGQKFLALNLHAHEGPGFGRLRLDETIGTVQKQVALNDKALLTALAVLGSEEGDIAAVLAETHLRQVRDRLASLTPSISFLTAVDPTHSVLAQRMARQLVLKTGARISFSSAGNIKILVPLGDVLSDIADSLAENPRLVISMKRSPQNKHLLEAFHVSWFIWCQSLGVQINQEQLKSFFIAGY